VATETIESPKVLALRQEIVGIAAEAEALNVTPATLPQAAALAGRITSGLKRLEEQRKFLVQPLNDHVTRINNAFRTWREPLESARRSLDGRVIECHRGQEAQAAEARAAVAWLDEPTTAVVPAVAQTVRAQGGTLTVKRVWTFEVQDAAAVPEQYKLVNEVALRAAVKSGVRTIAGVRIYETEQVAVRAE